MRDNHKVILTPLTPIHIGNGYEILPYEYVIKDKYMYKFNMMDVYENLDDTQKEKFIEYTQDSLISLRSFISQVYKEEYGYDYKVSVSDEFINLYNTKIKGVKNSNEENSLSINDFINSINKTYIPGSTLKGAIRSAYLYDLGDREKVFDYKVIKDNKGRIDKRKSDDKKSEEYEVMLLKCPNKNNKKEPKIDPFKAVKVSDTNLKEDVLRLCDINIYTYNKREDNFKKAIPFYSLCTKSKLYENEEFNFEFNINLFDGFYEKNNTKLKITKEDILNSLNLKAEDIINRELDFYDDINYIDTYNIYDEIYNIYNSLDKENEALIRFGKGCGFDSTTFNLINEKRNNVSDSKSRNLVQGKYPLGWAVIRFV